MQGYSYAPAASYAAQPAQYAQTAPVQNSSYTGVPAATYAPSAAYVAAPAHMAQAQPAYPMQYPAPAAAAPAMGLGAAPPQPEDVDFDAMKAQLKSEYDARVADLAMWFHHENDKIIEREREHKIVVQEFQEYLAKQNKHRELYEQIKRAEIDRYERDRESQEAAAQQAAKDDQARYEAWRQQMMKEEEARRKNPQLPTAKLGGPPMNGQMNPPPQQYGQQNMQGALPNTYAQPAAATQILSYGR